MRCSLARSLLLFVVLLASATAGAARPLTVHFFDVGQGDAALILSPAGKSVLIDGGPPEAGPALARRVAELVPGQLDLVILTHPHLDHLGGLADVLARSGAKRYLDPAYDHPSAAYRDWLVHVAKQQLPVMSAERVNSEPLRIGLGEGVALTLLWPRRPVEPFLANTRSDANSNSIVARLTYGTTSVLFPGDAEPDTERRLLREGAALRSTVLKVGHHGGRHSSTRPFLAAVRPQFAVISCGAANDYGHPARAVLERLDTAGAQVFRTDTQGEVVATSDGTRVTVRALGHAEQGAYVALPKSRVFHLPGCPAVARRRAELLHYTSRADAARTRRAAKDCHP